MKRGRNDLKQAASKEEEYQSSIAQVFSLRSCNQIEIMDAKEQNSLALLPAKFPESRQAVTQQDRRRRRGRRDQSFGIKSRLFATFYVLAVAQQKRRRRRRKGEYMCELPEDLVIEILLRLPSKSLMRFKCVSKKWSNLISCLYFCKRLFNTVTRQQPRLYMFLLDEGGHRVLLSISSTSPDNTSFVVVDQDLSIPGMGGFFLNVVRGLMCFSCREKACIYNPSTKQLLTLPAIKSDMIAKQGQKKQDDHTRYYIGHDPVSDQYKLVCTVALSRRRLANLESEHWVLALEAGGSWKKVVQLENYHHHAPFPLGRSTSTGSVVRYMAWPDNYNCVVVSFDIMSEQLTIIPVPREMTDYQDVPALTMKGDLIEYGGKIAIFHHTYLKDMASADLWVLEDIGRNEWSNKTLVLQPCQRHLVQDIELMVKGTTQDGKVILAPLKMHSQFYILYYDLQSNDLTKVEIKGVPPRLWLDKECYFDLNFFDESESFIYLET